MKISDTLKSDVITDSSDKNESSSFENLELDGSNDVSDKGTPPQGPTPRIILTSDETV